MGMWLGLISKDEYNNWKERGHALDMHDVRGLNMQPIPGNPGKISVNIGPPYPGDTKQLEITIFPHSVEVIGEIEEEAGVKICTGKPTLFNRYLEAISKWRAALSNIHTATPADLANLDKMKNVTKFPGK
jgi:hypothetical protein